jgi:PAS domain S-box-containing protein
MEANRDPEIENFKVFDLCPNMVYVMNREYRVLYQNKAHADYYGSHIGKPCFKVHEHNEAACPTCPINLTLDKGKTTNRVKPVKENGQTRLHEINSFPVAGADGKILYSVNISQDVTEKVRSEQDLILFKSLIYRSNDALLIIDPENSRILYVNDKVCSNLLYDQSELLGMKVTDIAMNVQDLQSWKSYVEMVRRKGFAFFETEQKRKDGLHLPVEINVRLIMHEGREFIVSVARDISERKRAEAALLAEKNKVDAVLAAIGDGITLQDRNFRILYQNELHRELQGDHVGELCYQGYHNRDQVCEGCLLLQSFEDGQVHRRETSTTTEQGVVHMEVTASPQRDAAGAIVAGIEIVRNTTERKKLEAQLFHSQKMEAVGHLSGGIAHDFNNILTAIVGFSNLLHMKLADDDSNRVYVEHILSSAERAAKLTKNLLAFSRKQVIDPQVVDVNEIVWRVEKLLSRLIGEDIELKITLAPTELNILADESQIEQILLNLVTNSRDAMPLGGKLAISTKKVELDEKGIRNLGGMNKAGSYVLLAVSDTGEGIDEKIVNQIFEPFFSTKEVGKGSGLGLSIVYGVVKQHDGMITVTSSPGRSSLFSIYLPLTTEPPVKQKSEESRQPLNGTETVLVAEDDAAVRDLVKQVLEEFGYRVIVAANGVEALAKFKANKERIQLVLLDVIMPKMNGKDTLDKIQAEKPGIKAIFMSGYTKDLLDKNEADQRQFHFIQKPVSSRDLLTKVREVLDLPQ